MRAFEFASATQVVFGSGTFSKLAEYASGFGRRALVVTGRNVGRAEPLLNQLRTAGVDAQAFPVPGEPTVDDVVAALAVVRTTERDLLIGSAAAVRWMQPKRLRCWPPTPVNRWITLR